MYNLRTETCPCPLSSIISSNLKKGGSFAFLVDTDKETILGAQEILGDRIHLRTKTLSHFSIATMG